MASKAKAPKAKPTPAPAAPKPVGKGDGAAVPVSVLTAVKDLKPHPRNYRQHPDDQRAHIGQSISEHGVYRNVVVAKDNTILAGHGVVQTAVEMGVERIPVVRLPIAPDSPGALKIVAGDNEIGKLSVVDDRALTELLKSIKDSAPKGLLGSGFDEMMLANLVFVTRPEGEVKDINAAAEWAGLPDYGQPNPAIDLVITFPDAESRKKFVEKIGGHSATTTVKGRVWSLKWPIENARRDWSAVKFTTARKGGKNGKAQAARSGNPGWNCRRG